MKIRITVIILTLGAIGLLALGCHPNGSTSPTRQDIVNAVFASGQLITDHEYLVTANADGFLIESYVEEGDSIRAGQALFVLSSEAQNEQLENAQANYEYARAKVRPDSPQLTQARLQVEQARIQFEADQKNYQRYQALVGTGAVSQADFDRINTQYENSRRNLAIAERALEDLQADLRLNLENSSAQLAVQRVNNSEHTMTSAIDGRVLSVLEQEGELVRRGMPVAKVGGGGIRIKLFIAEEDISWLEIGQKAWISLNTDLSRVYEAQISKIYPAFDEVEQSFVAEAEFTQRPEKLFPYTQLQANIVVGEKKDALTLPTAYLVDGDSVLLRGGRKVPVEVGIRNLKWVEITGGIDENQRVILPED